MHSHIIVSLVFGAILARIGAIFFLKRARGHGNPIRHKSRVGFFRGVALGNALQQLQTIVHPHTKHVIVQMADEEADEDFSGDPDRPLDPVAHLRRQAEKIRRGQEIDRITAVLAKRE
jgi:hypothetical protein